MAAWLHLRAEVERPVTYKPEAVAMLLGLFLTEQDFHRALGEGHTGQITCWFWRDYVEQLKENEEIGKGGGRL